MAYGKKSFVLYCDLIHTVKKLPKETRGDLFLLILQYVNDENPVVEDNLLLEVSFEPIKQQLKRDLKEWEGEKLDRSASGVVGNIARWHPDIYEQILNKQISIPDALLKIESLKSHGDKSESDGIANIANIAVNVTDNVTVTDNDNTLDNSDELPVDKKAPIVGVVKNPISIKKKVAQKKKVRNPDSEPHWKQLRAKWIWFNKTHVKFNPEPIPERDYSHLRKIVEKLRERSIGQAIEWTEQNAVIRFEKFLTVAFTKVKWLQDNFLLSNLEGQMQTIFKLIDNPNGQTKSNTNTVGKTIEFDRP